MVRDELGSPDGALIFDETSFVKKGQDSIGVARQYCGTIGKVENCQVGVFAAYASDQGYALIGKRLFLPEKWFDDDHALRRKKCKLPEDTVFKTKPQLAVEMLRNIHTEKVLPFRYVLADSVYGQSPEFIAAVESMPGKIYLVSVSEDTHCWTKRPATITRSCRRKDKIHTRIVLADPDTKPVTVKELAKKINPYFWQRRNVSEGTKGPIVYDFTRRRVILSSSGLPQKSVWLLIRRSLGDDPQYTFFISNASSSMRLKPLVRLSGMRWAIEQCFEETKTDLGMDHYEVRKFPGWHHHILTCILAHFFSGISSSDWEKKAPFMTVSQIRMFMELFLPLKPREAETIFYRVNWILLHNHRAYLSHRKKRLLELELLGKP